MGALEENPSASFELKNAVDRWTVAVSWCALEGDSADELALEKSPQPQVSLEWKESIN